MGCVNKYPSTCNKFVRPRKRFVHRQSSFFFSASTVLSFDALSICFTSFWLFVFRWLLKSSMRPMAHTESTPAQHNECIVIVGVSRSKLAFAFFAVMLFSLFLTFHVLYDSAVYSIQVNICSWCTHSIATASFRNDNWNSNFNDENKFKNMYINTSIFVLSTA